MKLSKRKERWIELSLHDDENRSQKNSRGQKEEK
jgi:hypothetical protein